MLSEYQCLAMQSIFRFCDADGKNVKFLEWLINFNPNLLHGYVLAIPFLSIVDGLNATSNAYYRPFDRDLVERDASELLTSLVDYNVCIEIGAIRSDFTFVDMVDWDCDFLYIKFSLSPRFVRLHADIADYLEKMDKDGNGFD